MFTFPNAQFQETCRNMGSQSFIHLVCLYLTCSIFHLSFVKVCSTWLPFCQPPFASFCFNWKSRDKRHGYVKEILFSTAVSFFSLDMNVTLMGFLFHSYFLRVPSFSVSCFEGKKHEGREGGFYIVLTNKKLNASV